MDEMKIRSAWMTGIVSKVISHALQKSIGPGIKMQVNDIEAVNQNGKTNLKLEIEMSNDDLGKLIESMVFKK